MWINSTKSFVLDLLFPKLCVQCGGEGGFLCKACLPALAIFAPSCIVCRRRTLKGEVCKLCRKKALLSRFFAPFSYKNEIIRDCVHLYKYGRAKELSGVLAEFLIRHLAQYGFKARKDMVFVPVPLHQRRRRTRGFNQSELLAEYLGLYFRIPIVKQALMRIKNTRPQIELENDEERRINISGAFAVTDREAVKNKTAILVDDVVTSGATLREAAQTLRRAGARTVWAVAIARR